MIWGRYFLTMKICCFSLNFWPLILAFICVFWLRQLYCSDLMVIFLNFPNSFYIIHWNSSVSMDTWIFIIWIVIKHYHYLICCSNFSSFGHWESYQVGFCVLLSCLILFPFCFVSISFLSGTTRCYLQAHLVFSLSQPRKQQLYKESQFYLLENGI